jgi:hypothetical protein
MLVALCLAVTFPPSLAYADPAVSHDVKHDVSLPLRAMAASTLAGTAQAAPFPQRTGAVITATQPDLVAQVPSGAPVGVDVGLNFDGLDAAQTVASGGPFVGRTRNDVPGTMEAPLYLVKGTGVQVKSFKRWGDYSSMSVDPEDGCTFWYSQEYYKTTGAFNWNTRVASFKFNGCH